jgi:HK97 family phage major capsid protein
MAEWDTAYINDLPDSAFACVDEAGRHYPHHNAAGEVDQPHLANAMARINQAGNTQCGRGHLEEHAQAMGMGERSVEEPIAEHNAELSDTPIQVRSATQREVDIRIMPWDVTISHEFGMESFQRGAFAGTNPAHVLLMGLDHETLMGIDQRGQPLIKRRPIGVGKTLEERDDAAYMTFKVARTGAGDEFLALASDGVVRGASIEWDDVPGGSVPHSRNGRRETRHQKVALKAVSPTWRPAYERAEVVAMRSEHEGVAAMADDTAAVAATNENAEAATPAQQIDFSPFEKAVGSMTSAVSSLTDRVEGMEERYRSQFTIPSPSDGSTPSKPKLHEWASVAARMLVGGRIDSRELHERALQDVISTDNPGQIPEAFVNDIIGVLAPRRPFLNSTTQIAAPAVGLSMTVPVFDTHSTVGVQSEEKTDIDSTAMKVTTDSFDAITIAGGADVSIQLIRRGEPSFFDLLIRDLGQAYAASADLEAVAALLGAGVTSGAGDLDPEALMVGDAWSNSISAIGSAPDHVWLSSNAVAEFIDAKDNGTNRPLYFNLNANFAAGTGTGGNVSALIPVYTPALDSSGVDVLIGPASGFVWAEDGTFQLQVDVPSKAGRDIAVVGILFLVPRYPTAFTSYSLAS